MNWGWKIAIVYTGFAVGILAMVFTARSKPVDLVAPDYYAQELAFGERIQAKNNIADLTEPIVVSISNKQLLINLPPECSAAMQGRVELYCPSNAALDRQSELILNSNQDFMLDLSASPIGHYIVRIAFKIGDKEFYLEQAIAVV